MTKIETGKSYDLQNGNVVRVIAQGFCRYAGLWVRYQCADGRTGDTQLNDAINYWKAA